MVQVQPVNFQPFVDKKWDKWRTKIYGKTSDFFAVWIRL